MCTSADKELIIKKLLLENLKMSPKIISLKSAKVRVFINRTLNIHRVNYKRDGFILY